MGKAHPLLALFSKALDRTLILGVAIDPTKRPTTEFPARE